MTRKTSLKITCPCGREFETEFYQSVNVMVNPELKEKVLHDEINVTSCPSCRQKIRLNVRWLYHDMLFKEMIYVYPKEEEIREESVKKEIHDEIAQMLKSPILSKNLIIMSRYRLVFGVDTLIQYLSNRNDKTLRIIDIDIISDL